MTTPQALTLKSTNKADLDFLIQCEMDAYAIRITGHDIDLSAQPDARGNFPRKLYLGAIEQITERSLIVAMGELQRRLDQGYTLFLSNILSPEVTHVGAAILYVAKPESIQAEDAKKIAVEVESAYNASIKAHNNKVRIQDDKDYEAEVARRLAVKLEEERQAMLDLVIAEMAIESAAKPRGKAAK